jgi:hypothetical protein
MAALFEAEKQKAVSISTTRSDTNLKKVPFTDK